MFLPSNKIYREGVQAKDLSAPLLCTATKKDIILSEMVEKRSVLVFVLGNLEKSEERRVTILMHYEGGKWDSIV